METTQTNQETNIQAGTLVIEKPQDTLPKNPNQSVYIADKDMVKTYPIGMSNDEIDYDLHTTVRGQWPEDYFVNFLPLKEIQDGFKDIVFGGPLGQAKVAGQLSEEVTRGAKYIATGDLEQTYKPWLDIWRESVVGKPIAKFVDANLAYAPAPIAAIPWFLGEFVPEQLLEFGTKPMNWAGAYGVQKFGPPIINKVISSLPKSARDILLKDIFSGEKAMKADFETLGINPNARTSEVVRAYKDASKYTHPDVGGSAEAFNKINTAYKNIMQSRGGNLDKIFDLFRGQEEAAASQAPKGIRALLADKTSGFLGNQRGSALIPGPDDLVKVGEELGKVISIAGEIATVNIAGRAHEINIDQIEIIPKVEKPAVNPENLAIGEGGVESLKEATTLLGKELSGKGKSLTHEEVIEKAKEADIMTQGVSRESTLSFQASLLKTRQHLAALAEENQLTPEFLDALKVTADLGTDIARNLESFKIEALPEHAAVKMKIIKEILNLGVNSEKILEAAKGVDFKDEQSVSKFYRQFVKPKLSEILDEFAYMNILSSPVTHITNAFSNLLQLSGLNPLSKLASGAVDFVGSKLTGAERKHYISEVPDFYKGALNAIPQAIQGATAAMKGKKNLERPDIQHIPTLSKFVDLATLKVGKYIPRALEASDIFFRTMIEAGEKEALSKALGHDPLPKELIAIEKEASKRANYFVFRNKPDTENKTGQGKLLSAIDKMTNAVYGLRRVPGVKWFIRFVQTPMNILKQGIEFSPAGVGTIKGSKDKYEQAGKAAIGSLVFAGASWLAATGHLTWAEPSDKKSKNEFYAAGLLPYSFIIGDRAFSYSRLGPIAIPLAMAAALHYYTKESPDALSDSEMDKVVNAMTGVMKFFSDLSYMQGVADLVNFAKGEKSKAFSSMPTQMIPLSSLQGWVNNIIDPLRRKAAGGLSIESVVDNIQNKVVGMSQFVPPQIDSEEIPVKKQNQLLNAFSPIKISKIDRGKRAEYEEGQRTKQEINKMKKEEG